MVRIVRILNAKFSMETPKRRLLLELLCLQVMDLTPHEMNGRIGEQYHFVVEYGSDKATLRSVTRCFEKNLDETLLGFMWRIHKKK